MVGATKKNAKTLISTNKKECGYFTRELCKVAPKTLKIEKLLYTRGLLAIDVIYTDISFTHNYFKDVFTRT